MVAVSACNLGLGRNCQKKFGPSLHFRRLFFGFAQAEPNFFAMKPLIFLFSFLLTANVFAAETLPETPEKTAPRIAIWNPFFGSDTDKFQLEPEYLNEVAAWLEEDGATVERPRIDQLGDTDYLSPQKFDAVFFMGEAFPRSATTALQKFAEAGGVLVALGAKEPFRIAIAPEANGLWTVNPKTPEGAWQSDAIYFSALGLQFLDPMPKKTGTVKNSVTPLFQKYLPETAPVLSDNLPTSAIIPVELNGVLTQFYPLIAASRADVTPQLFIARNGKRTAIISTNEFYTRATDAEKWPLAQETVVALARIAADLKNGKLKLEK